MEDRWLEVLRNGKCLPEKDLFQLCEMVKALLMEENNVQSVSPPVIICGNIHGQFYDLLEIFNICGSIPEQNYIFMGGYIDKGYDCVKTLELLLALKVKYPQHITLLRGNHESRQLSQFHGFYDRCKNKYGNANPWKYFTSVFDYLNIAAVVENSILCVHGGLSPDIKTIDQIRAIDRVMEIPDQGAFCDLIWSDPEDVETWVISPRGAGWYFGSRVTEDFNHINGLELVCRGHQLVTEGYKYWFAKNNLVTVWSAPNYVGRCGNDAAVLLVDQNMNRSFKIFSEVPQSAIRRKNWKEVPYFL